MNESENLGIIPKSRIDTNIVIRFLIGDGGDKAEKVQNLFKRVSEGKERLILCDTVFIEIVFVLQSVYKRERVDISNALRTLIRLPGIETETNIIILSQALAFYEMNGIDWADAVIAAKALAGGQAVYSFDNHFSKFPGVKRKNL